MMTLLVAFATTTKTTTKTTTTTTTTTSKSFRNYLTHITGKHENKAEAQPR
jgi:hypothetical protein